VWPPVCSLTRTHTRTRVAAQFLWVGVTHPHSVRLLSACPSLTAPDPSATYNAHLLLTFLPSLRPPLPTRRACPRTWAWTTRTRPPPCPRWSRGTSCAPPRSASCSSSPSCARTSTRRCGACCAVSPRCVLACARAVSCCIEMRGLPHCGAACIPPAACPRSCALPALCTPLTPSAAP